MKQTHRWTAGSLICHSLFALAAILQLCTSLLMGKHAAFGQQAFWLHQISGFLALAAILAYFSYTFWHQPNKWRHLYPYFWQQGLQTIKTDFLSLIQGKLPTRPSGGLAGAVQGLGLLLILAMALTGTMWFLSLHVLSWKEGRHLAMWLHHTLANWVWVYVIGHTAMAFLHRVIPKRFCQCF